MKYGLFQPIVTIDEMGRVDIDWADSFSHVYDDETLEEDWKDDLSLADRLDAILGPWTQGGEPSRLRRLADHIDRQRLLEEVT